jgi:hypothetical protein
MLSSPHSQRRDAENRAGCLARIVFLIIGLGLVLGALAALSTSVFQFKKNVFPTPAPKPTPAAPASTPVP